MIARNAYQEARNQQWEQIKLKFNLTDDAKDRHPMFGPGQAVGYLCKVGKFELYGTCQGKTLSSDMLKMDRFRSSCTFAEYHTGHCQSYIL